MAQVFKLPRLSSSAPVVTSLGTAAVSFTNWWNTVCNAIEGALNTLETQQTQIDEALGIANQADATANTANGAANQANQSIATITGLKPIGNGDLLANTSGAPAIPVDTSLSQLIDVALGNAQGDILYRGASGWKVLAPGVAGTKLTTGGAGADPSWT